MSEREKHSASNAMGVALMGAQSGCARHAGLCEAGRESRSHRFEAGQADSMQCDR